MERLQTRLSILASNLVPIPVAEKRHFLPDWPRVEVTPEVIESWERDYPAYRTTAVRCGDGVIGLDLDVDDRETSQALQKAIAEALGAPVRSSGSNRAAYLLRGPVDQTKRVLSYERGDERAKIEIQGRGCLLNVAGPKNRTAQYAWDRLPWEEPLTCVADLPGLLQSLDAIMRQREWTTATYGAASGEMLRDITPDLVFETERGRLSVPEIRDVLAEAGTLRMCMGPLRPGARNVKTGLASLHDGEIRLYDFATETLHAEPDTAIEDLGAELAAIAPAIRHRGAVAGPGDDRRTGEAQRGLPPVAWPDAPRRRNANPRPTRRNVAAVLEAAGWQARYNMQSGDGELWRDGYKLKDVAKLHLVDECDQQGISERGAVRSALENILFDWDVGYHPMEEWITAVPWDGKDRLTELVRGVTVEGSHRYWAKAVTTWLLQTVQGVCGWREPKPLELVLILLGDQGIGKTTWVRNLAPARFVKINGKLGLGGMRKGVGIGDDTREALSAPIVELGEFEKTYRAGEIADIKAFLSQHEDTDRKPYQTELHTRPRCTSFIGTGNLRHNQRDGTGSRRLLHFWAEKIERLEWDEATQQQLWAQAHSLWAAGKPYYLTEETERLRAQAESEFEDLPPAVENLSTLLNEASRMPAEQWRLCTRSEICEQVQIPVADRKSAGEIGEWLYRFWCPRICLARGESAGQKWRADRVWPVPFTSTGYAVSDAANRDSFLATIGEIKARLATL